MANDKGNVPLRFLRGFGGGVWCGGVKTTLAHSGAIICHFSQLISLLQRIGTDKGLFGGGDYILENTAVSLANGALVTGS